MDPELRFDEQGNAFAFDGLQWQPVNPETYTSNPVMHAAGGVAQGIAEIAAPIAAAVDSPVDVTGDVSRALQGAGITGTAPYYAGLAATMAVGAAPAFAKGSTAHIMRGATTPGQRIANGTSGILGEAKAQADAAVEGIKAQATARGFRNPNRSAGAAQADDVAGQRLETSQVLTGAEADDMGLPVTPAQRARLDATEGSPTGEIEEALRIDQNTAVGRNTRTAQQEWLRDRVAEETEIMGPVNKGNVTARLKAIGKEFDELEAKAPWTGYDAAVKAEHLEVLDSLNTAGTAGISRVRKMVEAAESRADVKQAMAAINKAADTAAKSQDTRGMAGLTNMHTEMREQLAKGMVGDDATRYEELRRQYAILKGLQENENVLKPGGNFNVNSFVRQTAKRFKPFGTGEDMSTLSRALRTMETLNRSEVKGSNTAYLLGAGGLGGGIAGLLGF